MEEKLIEIWKPIKGYEGLYEVSNLGRIRRLPGIVTRRNGTDLTIKGKLKVIPKSGVIKLSKDGEKLGYPVKNLVYESFIEELNDNDVVYNNDDNILNNNVNNLRVIKNLGLKYYLSIRRFKINVSPNKESIISLEEFPGYLLSSYGKIYSRKITSGINRDNKGRITRKIISLIDDYTEIKGPVVNIRNRTGKIISVSVAKLISQYFLEIPNEISELDPIPIIMDGNKDNCSVFNILYIPRKIYEIKILGEGFKFAKVRIVSILGKEYPSIYQAARSLGINEGMILRRLNSKLEKWKDWYYID